MVFSFVPTSKMFHLSAFWFVFTFVPHKRMYFLKMHPISIMPIFLEDYSEYKGSKCLFKANVWL